MDYCYSRFDTEMGFVLSIDIAVRIDDSVTEVLVGGLHLYGPLV